MPYIFTYIVLTPAKSNVWYTADGTFWIRNSSILAKLPELPLIWILLFPGHNDAASLLSIAILQLNC
jgi:hypothetical protein